MALVTATARLVEVHEHHGVFAVSHGFAAKIASSLGSQWASSQLCKFGFHRALRLAGCAEGDNVRLADELIEWHYPEPEFEAQHRPTGFGRWNSDIDGLAHLQPIVTPDPIPGLDAKEVAERAVVIGRRAVAILTDSRVL